MWTSNESAREAANGTNLAIRIDNHQFDEDSDGTGRSKIMIQGLAGGVGLDEVGSGIYIDLMEISERQGS